MQPNDLYPSLIRALLRVDVEIEETENPTWTISFLDPTLPSRRNGLVSERRGKFGDLDLG